MEAMEGRSDDHSIERDSLKGEATGCLDISTKPGHVKERDRSCDANQEKPKRPRLVSIEGTECT